MRTVTARWLIPLVALIALILVSAPDAVRAGDELPLVYQSPEHWSMTIPNGWARYPDNELKAMNERVLKQLGAGHESEAAYGPSDLPYFAYPLMLVRSSRDERGEGAEALAKLATDPIVYLEESLKSKAVADIGAKTKAATGFELEFGKVMRLARGDGMLMTAASEVPGTGKVKSLSAMIFGNRAHASITLTTPDAVFDESLKSLKTVIDSLRFEPGYRLSDMSEALALDEAGRKTEAAFGANGSTAPRPSSHPSDEQFTMPGRYQREERVKTPAEMLGEMLAYVLVAAFGFVVIRVVFRSVWSRRDVPPL